MNSRSQQLAVVSERSFENSDRTLTERVKAPPSAPRLTFGNCVWTDPGPPLSRLRLLLSCCC